MNDDLDALLREDFLKPPTDFAERVMKSLPVQIHPESKPVFARRLRSLVARVGVASAAALGAAVGLAQLASFVFGLWLSAAAL